ncbi:2-succinyl-5-enolpyruvyl-6-hydroxy-3-cyclohexene-1-carboxylic-acid synthase [soil metagenome]
MTATPSSPATDFSVALLAEFVALGIRDIVVCPGSRSQALALAAAEFERRGDLRLRVRIDERVAGFLALGLAVETATPVLVIATSGTAIANLHPAVLEAHHSSVPVIVLSADRPVELRGIAANQTTTQPGMFGDAAVVFDIEAPTGAAGEMDVATALARDAVAAAAGPVQLNLQFREPLSGPIPPLPVVERAETEPVSAHTPAGVLVAVEPRFGTLVVAGHGAGPVAEEVARALGAPLAAEVSSGSHFGPNLVVDYRTLLTTAGFGDRVERVIVFGHPTLTREVPALIQRRGVESIVVRSGPEDYNPGRAVTSFADALTVEGTLDTSPEFRSWLGRWVTTSRNALEQHDAPPIEIALSNEPRDQAAFNRAVIAGLRAPVSRRALVEAVWRMTWPHDRLVLGASRLIREADKVVSGKRISVHANRGLAGIDGTIGTGVGIALASQARGDAASGGVTRVLLGDLTLLHDVGSLLFGVGEARPRIQVIVGNDRGGTIFESLEVAQVTDAAPFERVMLTPQSVDFRALAAAYGWEYRLAANRGDLDASLTPGDGPTLVEVPLA